MSQYERRHGNVATLWCPVLTSFSLGHPVKGNSPEYKQIMRRIHKLIGKDDGNGIAKSASRSPKGIQKKKAGTRRRKSSTPSEPDTDDGFNENLVFPGDKHSSSGESSDERAVLLYANRWQKQRTCHSRLHRHQDRREAERVSPSL